MSEAAIAAAATIGAALGRARGVLEAAGLPAARREALELASLLRRISSGAVWLARGDAATGDFARRLEEAARRRAAGWPQAYAAGAVNFRGHWLAVDRRVLIPRPETEGLVDLVLEWIRSEGAGRRVPLVVADACTGSGAIAVALALEAPPGSVRLVATDCSAGALEVARLNLAALGARDRVEPRLGDLLEPLAGERVDAVVANPPYVAAPEWEELDPSVRDYEPREALVSGPDGMAAIRALVRSAFPALTPGGLLALEVDSRRAGLAARLAAAAGFEACSVHDDLFGRPRYLRARRPADGSDR